MKDFGERVQYSVFEFLITEVQFKDMKGKVQRVIDHDSDSVRFYTLCDSCKKKIEFSGRGRLMEDDRFFMV